MRILVPETPRARWAIPDDIGEDSWNTRARGLEISRVRGLALLPSALADAIPTLRYLAVGDAAPNRALFSESDICREELHDLFADAPAEESVVYEWDELRRVECIKKQCWWRVVNHEGRRVLVEISEEEGEEAQRVIEAGQDDMTAQIDRELSEFPHDV